MSNIEMLLQPVNNGRNKLPLIKVDDQVFAYSNSGLHTYPAAQIPPRNTWKRLGRSAVNVSAAVTKAYELYMTKYMTFNAINANPVGFAIDFVGLLLEISRDDGIWNELKNQDWEGVVIDLAKILSSASGARASGNMMRRSFNVA